MVAAFGIDSRNLPSQQPNGAEASGQHQSTHLGGSPTSPVPLSHFLLFPNRLVMRVVSALESA